jgi:hypothetical protein
MWRSGQACGIARIEQALGFSAVNEHYLHSEHGDALGGGVLCDEKAIVDVGNEYHRGRFTQCDGVPLPMGGGANESLREAQVGDECMEQVLWRPDVPTLINRWHVPQLGPRSTTSWH